jgi:phosphoacetylglucosamine mutase
MAGSQAMGMNVVDQGILTTPMLHHIVLHSNAKKYLPPSIPVAPTQQGYIDNFAKAYCQLVQAIGSSQQRILTCHVDCACGVGYESVQELSAAVQQLGNSGGGSNFT